MCILPFNIFDRFIFLRESLPIENRGQHSTKKTSLKRAFSGPISILFSLQLFVSLSLAGLEATFAYYAAQKAEIGIVELGYIFMIMGLAGAIVQGGLVGRLTKKYGEGLTIQLGILISAIGFGLILFVNSFVTAAIFLTIFGIGNGFIRPSVSALITKVSTAGHAAQRGSFLHSIHSEELSGLL